MHSNLSLLTNCNSYAAWCCTVALAVVLILILCSFQFFNAAWDEIINVKLCGLISFCAPITFCAYFHVSQSVSFYYSSNVSCI